MKNYSQQELEEMIICPKSIIEPPFKDMGISINSVLGCGCVEA